MLDNLPRATAPSLACKALTVRYGRTTILHGIDLAIKPRSLTVLVGPNGCGKSTLLRSLARVLSADNGQVLLDDKPIASYPTDQIARRLALLPQNLAAPDGLSVRDLVALGRHPHRRPLAGLNAGDHLAIASALASMTLTEIAERPLNRLSGGQRQRAWIAMTLAQETDLILMDEPTTYLDLKVQVDLMTCLTDLARSRGKTLVLVLHDLNLAAAFADHLVMMRDGRILAEGPPAEVMTPAQVLRVFDLEAQVFCDPETGRPVCLPRLSA